MGWISLSNANMGAGMWWLQMYSFVRRSKYNLMCKIYNERQKERHVNCVGR